MELPVKLLFLTRPIFTSPCVFETKEGTITSALGILKLVGIAEHAVMSARRTGTSNCISGTTYSLRIMRVNCKAIVYLLVDDLKTMFIPLPYDFFIVNSTFEGRDGEY